MLKKLLIAGGVITVVVIAVKVLQEIKETDDKG